tara:strand:+ start:134 stop:712 length:579 start_codon:yes stop_codon:yes gene_type:complete
MSSVDTMEVLSVKKIDSVKEIETQDSVELDLETDLFNDALEELYKEFEYKSQNGKEDKLYIKGKSELKKLTDKFKECSDGHPIYDLLPNCEADFESIRGVKSTFIKAEKPFDGQLYLKAHIQEWEFENSSIAKSFESAFNECRVHSECVNKGGITWWRVENRIYTIETPAYRYSFEFDKIKEVMNRKLNEKI